MKKISKYFILLVFAIIILCGVSYAVWWGTPGYEWALSKKLTPVKTQSQLNQTVLHTDLYSTIVKYLEMKDIRPSNKTIPHTDNMNDHANVIAGIFEMLNSYITKTELTADEYRQVESLIEHAKDAIQKNESYMRRENVKNIALYMDLCKYKAASLIKNRYHREYYLSKVGNVKNIEILKYGIIPYSGDITRREFLVVMYNLLTDTQMNADSIIETLNSSGVLLGYNNDLMLDRELTYAELLTFLYRYEMYDFNVEIEVENEVEDTAQE